MAAGAMAAANARTSSLEARQAMGGDDPAMPTPTFEPVRRPSPAYGLSRGNLVAGGCRQGGRERARVSEQTRTARCAQRGRPGLPPGTPCSSRPRPCTWSTAAAAARAPCRTPRCRTRARRRGSRARRLRQTVCSLLPLHASRGRFHFSSCSQPMRVRAPSAHVQRLSLHWRGGVNAGGRERARVSEQTRTARCARRVSRFSHLTPASPF